MKRRDFLKTGLKAGVAVNALPLLLGGIPIRALGRSPLRSALQGGSTNSNVLVIIQLQGGNDGLNCLVPHGDPLYKQLRPTLGLSVGTDGLHLLSDHDTLAFHGSMTGFAGLYNAGKVCVLQNVGYPNPDLSHFRGTDVWHTATDASRYASTGWLGRMLYGEHPDYPPAVIATGSYPLAIQFGNSLSNLFLGQNGGMGIALNKIPTESNPSVHDYDAIPANPTAAYIELDYVRTIQQETEVYTETLLKRSVIANKVTYPVGNTLGDQLAQVAQLIASGFDTKVYLVTQNGYDTHSNQATDQATLLGDLSNAITAFQSDLEAFGVADRVVGMTYSEFGRRPKENGSGTDHGTAAPLFVFGTQVTPGVKGSNPNLSNLIGNNLNYESAHDFRNVYSSMMSEWLGITDTAIRDVLTSNSGQTYSTINTWQKLGIIRGTTGAVQSSSASGIALMQNYPNPASGQTTFEFALPATSGVELGIYDIRGVEVARIADGRMSEGVHTIAFDTKGLPAGNYLYKLRTSESEVVRQMVLVR